MSIEQTPSWTLSDVIERYWMVGRVANELP
jgi:hypothetical protein